jgi:MPBQ/MSBQ methyltransferase
MPNLFFRIVVIGMLMAGVLIFWRLRRPSKRYTGPASVSGIYDAWTADKKMKFYWGNHLHAGFYGQPPEHKEFIQAKFDMIDEMVRWGIAQPDPELFDRLENLDPGAPRIQILDVGCGVGGTAIHLAQRWSKSAQITGITLSSAQVHSAAELARSRGAQNVDFMLGDAMDQAFGAESFDIIWTLESESHMPDKERFVAEIARLLKPGGRVVTGTWNLRDTRSNPLTTAEKEQVQYILDEWCSASFDGIHESVELLERHGLHEVLGENWTAVTLPSWRHSVLVALRDGRGLASNNAKLLWSHIRDAYTILLFDSAFRKGICEYGLFRGRKPG